MSKKLAILKSRAFVCGDDADDKLTRINLDKIGELQSMEWEFANDEKRSITIDQINGLSEPLKIALLAHGLGQKLANSYASAATQAKNDPEGRTPIDWAVDTFDEHVAMIFEGGAWASESTKSGPRIATLFNAVCAVMDDAGQDYDADALRGRLISDETFRKTIAEVKEVAAKVATIQAEAAAEKARKAQEALSDDSEGASLADVLGS